VSLPATVVKVGGSLFDLPDLGPRLRRWLAAEVRANVLLVPGGGAAADVVRDLDRRHALGEERSHWLALRALTLNAHFLASLLPGARVTDDPTNLDGAVAPSVAVLDPHGFLIEEERLHGPTLPHTWAATSDSVAARAAVVAGASLLVLLKSVRVPEEINWEEAGQRGFVDPTFAAIVGAAPRLQVRAIDFRP
jgi:aspartokinase-like uncharacterized kinase